MKPLGASGEVVVKLNAMNETEFMTVQDRNSIDHKGSIPVSQELDFSAIFGITVTAASLPVSQTLARLVVSSNENKIEFTSGTPAAVQKAESDSISILDFSSFPSCVRHSHGFSNTVIGPFSNLQFSERDCGLC